MAGEKLVIDEAKFGKLLRIAIEQRNKTRVKDKVVVKDDLVCKHFVRQYLKMAFAEIIEKPVAHNFDTEGISHLQVLQFEARKGFEWDQKYNGKDWEIVLKHHYPYVKVTIDEKLVVRVRKQAIKGMRYMEDIVNPKKNLDEIYVEIK